MFPNPSGEIGKVLEFSEDENIYISVLLDRKTIKFEGKNYNIVKYNIDQSLSQDEESNKIFVHEFGVIIETYWKKNFFQVKEVNNNRNKVLEHLTSEIINDEQFLWNQEIKKK